MVDSRGSMHMLNRKDLNCAELETVRVFRNSTTVVTSNGEVQTNEEATVYVYDLDLFVTVQILVDTLAVSSLVKLCKDHGHSDEWTSGQKPHLIKIGRNIQSNAENCAPIAVPGLSTGSSSSSAASTSPTSLPDTSDDSSSSPAATRRDSTGILVLGKQLRDPTETKNTIFFKRHLTVTGRLGARYARMIRGVHRKSSRRRRVSIKGHTCKQFS